MGAEKDAQHVELQQNFEDEQQMQPPTRPNK